MEGSGTRRGGHFASRPGRHAVHRHHLHDDCRDIVEASTTIGFGNHCIDHATRRPLGLQNFPELRVFDHTGQSVGAEQIDVAVLQVALQNVRLDRGVCPDAARDHVAVGVITGLLGREEAGIDLLLHVRVILGELRQRSVAHEVPDESPTCPMR